MRTVRVRRWSLVTLVLGLLVMAPTLSHGQFVAINGQAASPGLGTNSTTWNVFGNPPGSSGALRDVHSGAAVGVQVNITANGIVTASAGGGNPSPGTPLYDTFSGFVSFPGADVPGALARIGGTTTVTFRFTGLSQQKLYNFVASAVGGGTESTSPQQWSQFQIDGTSVFTNAHTPGCYTNGLAVNQVAVNTGINTNGDMVVWKGIVPDTNGSFSVSCSQYTGLILGGGTANGPYGYALSVFRLEEINPGPPSIISATSRGDRVDLIFSLPVQSASATNLANYALTNLYGPVAVLSAAFGTNDQSIRLTTGRQLPFMIHWLNIAGIVDAATGTNVIAPDSQVTFTNVAFTTGYSMTEIYRGIAGTTISALTNSANYPAHPSLTEYFPYSYWFDSAVGANYGGRLSGILVPPVSGDYEFHFYTMQGYNAACLLSLGTNEDSATRIPIADRLNPSGPITLVGGQHYYFEALVKEGTGASDFVYIEWKQPGSDTWSIIWGDALGNYFAPVGAKITITQQPADANVFDGREATFAVSMTHNSKIVSEPNYQWQENGVDIPGATQSSYMTPRLYPTNSGAVYRVLAVIPGAAQFSREARLTVTRDVVPPTVVKALSLGANTVQLLFSEALEPSSATDPANYTFTDGIKVSQAVLDIAYTTVTLTTGPLVYGSNYSIVINGVQDQAMIPNTVAANTRVSLNVSRPVSSDIGKAPLASSAVEVANGLNIVAAGTNIGGASDQFNFNYRPCSGDFDLRVRVASLSFSDLWAKAGLMARETLDPGSRFAAALATPSMNGAFFESRDSVNGSAVMAGGFEVNYPDTWLRLQRFGSSITGYASYDGQTWAVLGSSYTSLPNLLFIGFAVSSHSASQAVTAEFRDWGAVGTNAVLGTVSAPREALGPCSRKTPVTFSEIMYKPAPRTDGANLEFVELYNSNPWFHDISGYQVVGDAMNYTLPAGTIIPGGSFLVLAASPSDISGVYGITNVVGPYSGSLKTAGTIQLLDEHGAVLLTVPYSNLSPWPVAADGTGHSFILANPSYGEEDPSAWDISDTIGGSPGRAESFRPSPLRNVVINEILAHTEDASLADFIELYNHSDQTNDLSGCVLTDSPTSNKFTIPAGTLIPPGGYVSFDQSQLGFGLKAAGETLYFLNPDRSRVLDAVQFEAQADGVSFGRWPDGANAFYPLASRTPGTNNSSILIGDIVINELLYHPISGDDDDQFIELYNQGTNTVSLAGWRFTSGITFTFPTNATMAPGSYLVIARNQTNLFAKYPNLNPANTVGDYSGKLSHRGERIALAIPRTLNGSSTIYVVEDEVTYGTGGRWGQWSSGGGSSLELIDPRSNHRLAANWTDSDDTKKSVWTNIEATGVMDNGSAYGSAFSYAQIGQLDAGECLVDGVEVRLGTSGANLVKNPGFESGLDNWSLQGCMCRSSLENSGYSSARSLHIRCSSRIWTGVNSCQAGLNSGGLAAGQTATLRFKARWLHGWPEVLLRLKGNWLEAVGTMPVPPNLGTPGDRNSRAVANAGPAIYEVTHTPAAPANWDPVVVTARVNDPDGLRSITLNYRADYDSTYTKLLMTDDGKGGDAVAGDGIFSATMGNQIGYGVAAFYVSAIDGRGAATRFPALVNDNGPARECLVRFGDDNPGGSFGSYHLWLSQTNLDRWSGLPNLSNEMIDGTFVNGKRVIYNMTGRFAGSPYHQQFYSPQYSACHFKWVFPDDDKFLGATSFNKIHSPGNSPGDDDSLQREQIANTFLRTLGVPWLNRRYVTVFVNGQQNVQLMEDTQCPDADMVREYFPNDSNGYLYKMQPWFEFAPQPSGSYIDFNNVAWCTVLPYTTTGKVKKTARYRYNFMVRSSPDSLNNFDNVFSLVDAASAPNGPNYAANLEGIADMENWMRVFAANHAAGNWDSFGTQNGQNLYGYIGTEGTKYSLMMFDFNIVLGNSDFSWGPGQSLFTASDSNIAKMYSNPTFRRMYIRALQELVDGPLDVANAGPLIDAKYATFIANGLSATKPATLKGWLTSARRSIASQIASATNAPFSVNPTVVISNEVAIISGLAPVKIKTIQFDGIEWPLTWTSVTAWTATVPLKAGANLISIAGLDRHGQPVPGAINQLPTVYDGTISSPVGKVVINEVMYAPVAPNGQYVELYNNSSNITFNLSGCELQGLGYTFPAGSLIKPNGFLVLAANRTAFAAAYGATHPVFGTFSQPLSASGQILALVRPTGNGTSEVVTELRYESVPPWPGGANGTGKSLQLIDPQQDNWRVANWTASSAPSPSSVNAASTNLPAFPSLCINELQADNLTGITNNAGQHAPWLEIYNPSTQSVSLDGVYLASSYTNLAEWAFPSGVAIKPGEYKVIFADGQTNLTTAEELHTSFTLPSGSGSLALSQPDTNNQPQVMDYANYANVSPNHSYGSFPDGQSFDRQEFFHATPGGTNDNSGNQLTVAINEWMAANTFTMGDPVTGKFEDWFELYNYGDQPMDLTGYFLTHSLTNQFEFPIPAGYTIPPHGFLLVWADKRDTNSTPDLHTNFKLSKSGTSIGLYAADGRPVDFVTFGPQTSDLSMGRYPDGGASIYMLPVATPRARNAAPNTAPVLQPAGDVYVILGQSLTFAAKASDADQPPQRLSFSLGTGAPKGATINATGGLLSWTPTSAPATNWVNIIVTDDGVPSLSAAQPARLIALLPPTLSAASLNGNLLSFTWPAASAHSYQLESTEDLVHSNWTALGSPVTGTGTALTLTNALDLSTNRYFRLRLLP